MVLVSVIVPAYNAECTLDATLRSALGQSHRQLELIVVDDGSTDRTAEIAAACGDPRVRLLRCSNAGQAVARNRGLEAARGEYLAFLDADDLWTSGKLAAQLDALDRRPEAGVAYSWVDWCDSAGDFHRAGSRSTFEGDVAAALLQVNFVDCGSNLLMRRGLADEVGGFCAERVPAEDWDYSLRLAERSAFAVVPEAHVRYRVSSASQSADAKRLLAACVACVEQALQRRPDLLPLRDNALANVHRYALHRRLERPPAPTERAALFSDVLSMLRALVRNDPRMWRRSTTRRVLLRTLCFSLLSGDWPDSRHGFEAGLKGRILAWTSVRALLGQIRVRTTTH